jgi:FecR protein
MDKAVFFAAAVVAIFVVSNHEALAGPLTQAEVTKIINQVSLIDPQNGGRPAALQDVIKDELGLETGKKSRSELLFQDDTLTRLGAETFFSFKTGTRDMTLEKGSMLLQVPKGLGGAQIHTAAVTAAITGTTIMLEYIPKQYIKVLVLEGSLRLSRNGILGDSVVLRPGKMVIMRPDAKKIPEPVDVDLAHIVKTSSLVNFPDAEPLPSMSLIQTAIDDQQSQLATRDLVPTNLVMGHGTNVVLAPILGPNGLLGATLNGGSATLSLPLVTNVASTLGGTTTTATTIVNNLLGSSTAAVGGVANNLLGTTSALASIPITSSTQLVSLLNNAVPTAGGVIAIVPTMINPVTTSITAPAGIVASNPTVSSVTTTVANAVGGNTGSAPTATSLPTILGAPALLGPPVVANKPPAPIGIGPLSVGLGH